MPHQEQQQQKEQKEEGETKIEASSSSPGLRQQG